MTTMVGMSIHCLMKGRRLGSQVIYPSQFKYPSVHLYYNTNPRKTLNVLETVIFFFLLYLKYILAQSANFLDFGQGKTLRS